MNETAGDGLMVIFQRSSAARPERGDEDDALNATRAALAIRQRTLELNEEHTGIFPPVQLHMGINTGQALLGATKKPLGVVRHATSRRGVRGDHGYGTLSLAVRIVAHASSLLLRTPSGGPLETYYHSVMPTSDSPRSPDSPRAAAKLAVARLPRAPGKGDRVELRLILVLGRDVAERLAARAIVEEKNLGQLVLEIVEAAASG